MNKRPNVLVILNDDMGFSDIGCYGGEIDTPNLNALSEGGLKFTQFYNSPRCAPTRASLLTGLHPHQTGIGILVGDYSPEGYEGTLNKKCVTMAEALKENGYATYLSGKWHLCNLAREEDTWPCQRGFDEFYGTITGAADYFAPKTMKRNNKDIDKEVFEDKDYYFTDAISNQAVEYIDGHDFDDSPMFLYVAYTASHWPLHAKKEDILKYKGRFDKGWDVLRKERMERLKKSGIIKDEFILSQRDDEVMAWEDNPDKEWDAARMEVYAAQIDCMDQGIGKIIEKLKEKNQFDDTLIMFLADNGACAEELGQSNFYERLQIANKKTKEGKDVRFGNVVENWPGSQDTYMSYGKRWANMSNTPFRLYKHYTHEGGIATPFIVSYPNGFKAKGEMRKAPCQLVDIMPTVLDYTNTPYPQMYKGNSILPREGESLRAYFDEDLDRNRYLYWEHEGNCAVRKGDFKLVSKYPGNFELYDLSKDRTETDDVITKYPKITNDLKLAYEAFEERAGVIDREIMLRLIKEKSEKE